MKFKSRALVLSALATCVLNSDSTLAGLPRIQQTELDRLEAVYQLSATDIETQCAQAIESAQARLIELKVTDLKHANFSNTVLAFENITADFNEATTPLVFMAYVSTADDVREKGSDCEQKVGKFFVDIFTDRGLYEVIKDQTSDNPDEARLASETIAAFKKNGLDLDDTQLALVREKKQRLTGLESEFSENLNNDTSSIEFTAEELEGVPLSFKNRLKVSPDGKFIVTTKSTDYLQVVENARNPETRKRMLFAYENRAAAANTPLLTEAIEVRRQIAQVMGYNTWADYRIQGRMAGNGTNVLEFLNKLKGKLAEKNTQDLNILLDFKKTLDPSATAVDAWDIRYLANQVMKDRFTLDNEEIRKYFPVTKVISGMFDVYSQLLGVRFEEVVGAATWSENVKLYRTVDAQTGELISHFYTDFYPREGKYGHAAAFTLVAGRMMDSGYNKPVSAIVANFAPPIGNEPSLMSHDEVETVFHEFGHIMHQTLTRGTYASLSGSNTAQDFVEAPSQMLENWVWSPEILRTLSGHYQNPSQPLPQNILDKMIEAKNFNQGYLYTRQLVFGFLDMTYHTATGPVDVNQTYHDIHTQLFGVEPVPGSQFPASFGHLMGGYDAGYYGYLWSEVYAQDMFTLFENGGLLSPEIGGSYRSNILEKGNMLDPMTLLRSFLGREPNEEAFFRKLGIR